MVQGLPICISNFVGYPPTSHDDDPYTCKSAVIIFIPKLNITVVSTHNINFCTTFQQGMIVFAYMKHKINFNVRHQGQGFSVAILNLA